MADSDFVTCDQLPTAEEQNLSESNKGEQADIEENHEEPVKQQDEVLKPEDVEISSVKNADFEPAKESRYSKFTKEEIDENANEKPFLGRSPKSWAGLLGFYVIFYCTLFFIFFAFLNIVYNNTPENHPYLTGRGLQSPGLSFVPNLDINDHQDHIFNRLHNVNTKAAAVYKNDGEEYKKYVSAIDQYFSENEDIDASKFGECGVKPYGWSDGTPCFFFKLNKIYMWEPQGLFGADVLSYFDGGSDQKILGASDQSFCSDKSEFCNNYGKVRLTEMLKNLELENSQDANKVPVRCIHYSKGTEVPIDYFPENGTLDWSGPFKGKETSYTSPLTAIRFNLNAVPDKEHRFYCFAFDRNVELEYKKETSGITSFFLKFEKTV